MAKTATITIPYAPREHQRAIHSSGARFAVLVCHRRFGKTVAAVNELIKSACTCTRQNPRYAYIAPMYKQAKAVAWDYLQYYTRVIPGMQYNVAELRADFPNGARISLLGADNPDGLRGIYLDGVVLDEYAQMPPSLWSTVIRPTLSDRLGWAMFIGTPQGHNAFWDLYSSAREMMTRPGSDWWAAMYRASETGIVDAKELESARSTMTPEQYEQEYECSFTAAILGAYYGKTLSQSDDAGRITSVPYDPAMLVHTAWDLGMSDSTVVWFFQVGPGGEIRIIDYDEGNGIGLPGWVARLRERPYLYGTHIAPHDIRVRELGTGKSRLETAEGLGIRFDVAPNLPI
ncbi:MAG: hypothetical protein JEY79_19360, partial [Pseudodesulfovibrio sp.]|nr:hypothetical protein [Pseudodesulfovibrio sp.]